LKWRGVAIPLWQGHVAILAYFGGSLDSGKPAVSFRYTRLFARRRGQRLGKSEGHAAELSRMR
jgi:hypothetical protein